MDRRRGRDRVVSVTFTSYMWTQIRMHTQDYVLRIYYVCDSLAHPKSHVYLWLNTHPLLYTTCVVSGCKHFSLHTFICIKVLIQIYLQFYKYTYITEILLWEKYDNLFESILTDYYLTTITCNKIIYVNMYTLYISTIYLRYITSIKANVYTCFYRIITSEVHLREHDR